MKVPFARRASLIVVGAIMLLMVPITDAFALATISAVKPAASPRGVQIANVEIDGSSFSNLLKPTVDFGSGIAVSNVRVQSSTVLFVDIDIASNAAFGVRTVTVDDGLGADSCQCFTVTPPPTLSGVVSPSNLAVGGGPVTYTIGGTGFLNGATIQISGLGVTAGATTVAGDGKSLTVPLTAASTAVTGSRNLTVTNVDGQSATCFNCFTVVGPPRAAGLFPAQRAGGLSSQNIDIVGSGFDNTTTVAFSGSGITQNSLQRISSTNLRVNITTAPDAALGARDVTFNNTDNGGHSVCTGCFTITGPTTVSITTPSTINGPAVVTFSQPVSGVSSSNTFIRYSSHTYNLPTALTCADRDGFLTSCATGFVMTATLRPTANIIPGEYYTVRVAVAGQPPITDFGGLTVAETSQNFRGGLFQQGESIATAFAWRTVKTTAAYGGSYVADHVAGASAAYRFTGAAIIWYTNIGPNYGIADLYVDGVRRAVVNCYSTSTHYRAAFTVSGFNYGAHTLTVRVRGVKGSSHGTGADIAIDAFTSGRTIITTPGLAYTWGTVSNSAAFGGLYSWSDGLGSTATFTFRGTQVEWDTVLGPMMGRAKVYIDGVQRLSTDNYAATMQYGVQRIFSGLTDTVHTLRIVVSGTHRIGATGSFIAVDRWVVT
jgi:hypothetical protein